MKNKKIILILSALVLLVIGYFYFNKNDSDIVELVSNSEKYHGLIKSISRDQDNNYQIGFEKINIFSGKEAILAAMEDFQNGYNKGGDWSVLNFKFANYNEAVKAIKQIPDKEIDDTFHNWQGEFMDKNDNLSPGGVLGHFPNGLFYSQNHKKDLLKLPLDQSVRLFFTDQGNPFSLSEVYDAWNDPARNKVILDKQSIAWSLDGLTSFTVLDGKIHHVEMIYRP